MTEKKLEGVPQGDLEEMQEPLATTDAAAGADVEALRAERDQLRAQVDEHEAASKARQHRGRAWAVGLLILLGCILLAAANVTFWLRDTVLSTDGWVAALGPLSRNETVANTLSLYVVGEVFNAVDVASLAEEALPEELKLLSGALAGLLQDVAQDAVTAVILSDQFNAVWVTVNRAAHATVMEVLRGDGSLVYLRDGQLTVDLSDVLDYLQGSFDLQALGLFPEEDWGKFVLLESQQVAALQQALALINTVGLLLPLLALGSLVVAWLISLWRHRTLMWIGIGVAITMALSLVAFALAQPAVLVLIADPFVRLLAGEIWDVVTRGLIIQTILLLVIGLAIAVGATLVDRRQRA
jgi:hypothetical protein